MANQSPDRREVLALLGRIAAVSQFPGFSRWMSAAAESSNERAASYQPLFFTPMEYGTVDLLSEHIIPAGDSRGARDAGVSEFIDFLVAHDPDLQYPFRTGIAWLQAFALEKNSGHFQDLPFSAREGLLRKLAYRTEQSPSELAGQEFFVLMRKYTVIGYYTSRIGLEELAYPGLQIYGASPECPHKDDPEHTHLGAPRV